MVRISKVDWLNKRQKTENSNKNVVEELNMNIRESELPYWL